MRIVFAGTPEFAASALKALIEARASAGFEIPLVLSQPDRPSGRGMKLMPGAVKQLALEHGIAVATPASLRRGDEADQAIIQLHAAQPDVLVVAAYGLILPQQILDIPRGVGIGAGIKAINIHASALPRWRGAAPIVRAIEAGDSDTGITLMQMDAGLDTGPMLTMERIEITNEDTAATLGARLAQLGADMIVQALRAPDALIACVQPKEGVSYAHKLQKLEAWLDFSQPAATLERRLRAFDPFPAATTTLRGTALKIWRAQALEVSGTPGTVLRAGSDGIVIGCGQGALVVTQLQRPGGKRLSARDFLAGFPIAAGQVFERAPLGGSV